MPQITIEIDDRLLKQLLYISRMMKVQDAMSTSDPVYVVYDRKKIACSEDYADGFMWISGDSSLYTDDQIRKMVLEGEYFDQDDKLITEEMAQKMRPYEIADAMDMQEFPYKIVNQFRALFFTQAEADAEIQCRGYHYEDPFVYVESACENDELKAVRRLLLAL